MKTNQKVIVRAALALLALCGFSTFGVATVSADVADVVSGNTNALSVTKSSSDVVTITPETGDISASSQKLVTGETVYNAIYSQSLDLGYENEINTETNVTAVGYKNIANGEHSSALGSSNTASSVCSNAVGFYNNASANHASAVGSANTASDKCSSAFGFHNTASGAGSTAVGVKSVSTAVGATAMGFTSYAGADGATAIGFQAVSTESGTVSFGHKKNDPNGSYTVLLKYDENTTGTAEVYRSYAVGESCSDGSRVGEVIACEANNYDSDSFARLTNVADGKDKNDAATYGQIAKAGQTITNTQNELKDNNGNVIATFKIGSASFTAGDNVEISDDNVISVKADGKVEAGNTGIVTGGEVYDHLSGMKSDLEGQINKVGAGAAALAMLHSETFDPANKWNFAVGYGHYKNANAGALGAFYKPNADTTVSVASTMGNGNPMFGAGVSFKIGRRGQSLLATASNAELVQEVNHLRAQNSRYEEKIDAQEKRIENLEAMVQKLVGSAGKV